MTISRLSLKGKVAIVTGANRGIGAATAIELARVGADVVISSRNTPGRGLPDLAEVAGEIKKLGRKVLSVPAHLGRIDQIKSLVEKVISEFGRIDILVNNAGTSGLTPVLEAEEKHWDAIMNLNLKGLFFLSQAVAGVMKKQGGGSIINVASISGIKPEWEVGIYSISKAGVIMATKVMASELAKYNIRVNTVAPGPIQTRLFASKYVVRGEEAGNAAISEVAKRVPLERIGDPSEIADAVVFLASEASSFVTGQMIVVDGGVVLR